jgi:hypothetical protein
MAWRDRRNNAALYDFIRQLTMTPLTDGTIGLGWPFTGQGDDLAHLRGRELCGSARFGRVRHPFGRADFFQRHSSKLQPAPSPVARSFVVNAQFPSNLQVVQTVTRRQHDPRSQGQLLASREGAYQALQLRPFSLTQYHSRRSRRGHRSFRSNQDARSYPAFDQLPAPFRPPVLVEVRRPAELLRHGLIAGVIAGITLVAEEMVATVLLGGSASDPFRLVASVVFGRQALSPDFAVWIPVLVGVAAHLVLSVLFGLVFVFLVAGAYQLAARVPLLLIYGVLYGLGLWEMNV